MQPEHIPFSFKNHSRKNYSFFLMLLHAFKNFIGIHHKQSLEELHQSALEEEQKMMLDKRQKILSLIKENYTMTNLVELKNNHIYLDNTHIHYLIHYTPTQVEDLLKNDIVDVMRNKEIILNEFLSLEKFSKLKPEQQQKIFSSLTKKDNFPDFFNYLIENFSSDKYKFYDKSDIKKFILLAEHIKNNDSGCFIPNQLLVKIRSHMQPFYQRIIDDLYDKNIEMKRFEGFQLLKIENAYQSIINYNKLSHEQKKSVEKCLILIQEIDSQSAKLSIEDNFHIKKIKDEHINDCVNKFLAINPNEIHIKNILFKDKHFSAAEIFYQTLEDIESILIDFKEKITKNNHHDLVHHSLYISGLKNRLK